MKERKSRALLEIPLYKIRVTTGCGQKLDGTYTLPCGIQFPDPLVIRFPARTANAAPCGINAAI